MKSGDKVSNEPYIAVCESCGERVVVPSNHVCHPSDQPTPVSSEPSGGESRVTGPWKCYHCGELFIDRILAAEHFGDNRLDPRPARCQGILSAIAETFERHGIHRNFHNAASVNLLVEKWQDKVDRLQAEIDRLQRKDGGTKE